MEMGWGRVDLTRGLGDVPGPKRHKNNNFQGLYVLISKLRFAWFLHAGACLCINLTSSRTKKLFKYQENMPVWSQNEVITQVIRT